MVRSEWVSENVRVVRRGNKFGMERVYVEVRIKKRIFSGTKWIQYKSFGSEYDAHIEANRIAWIHEMGLLFANKLD